MKLWKNHFVHSVVEILFLRDNRYTKYFEGSIQQIVAETKQDITFYKIRFPLSLRKF